MERKILIVDDEESIRDLFHDFFSDAGYTVSLATNAEEALRILDNEKIMLMFLDLKLFGMDGIQLCRQIRRTNHTAIIYAITGWAGLFEIEECREAGFDDFFIKPIKLDQMSKVVEGAFEKLDRWLNRPEGR
jgi:DNA-binding response OmpR family regulator